MYEWFNEILPLMNTRGMRDMAVLRVGPTATGVDLRSLFGNRTGFPTGGAEMLAIPSGTIPNIDAGHFYTIQADAAGPTGVVNPWRAYLALSPNLTAIDEQNAGQPTGLCWALTDGQKLRGRLPSATIERATGVATLFASTVLNFKAAAGAGTGWLRIYRSSLGEGQNPGTEFKFPA